MVYIFLTVVFNHVLLPVCVLYYMLMSVQVYVFRCACKDYLCTDQSGYLEIMVCTPTVSVCVCAWARARESLEQLREGCLGE